MSKFAQVRSGKLARKSFEIASILNDEGKPVTVDLLVLDPGEEAATEKFARQFSVDRNGTGVAGDPNYELGHMIKTLLLAVIDHDADKPEPFFASVDEVLSARELGRDGLAFLYEQQKAFQRERSLGVEAKTATEFLSVALEVARLEDPAPFCSLRLSSQLSYVLFTAHLLVNVPKAKWPIGSDSGDSGELPPTSSNGEP